MRTDRILEWKSLMHGGIIDRYEYKAVQNKTNSHKPYLHTRTSSILEVAFIKYEHTETPQINFVAPFWNLQHKLSLLLFQTKKISPEFLKFWKLNIDIFSRIVFMNHFQTRWAPFYERWLASAINPFHEFIWQISHNVSFCNRNVHTFPLYTIL